MNCKEARILVHASLDAQLLAGEKASLDHHLLDCSGCEGYAKVFGALKGRLSAMAATTDGAVATAVLDRCFESGNRPGQQARWLSQAPFSRYRAWRVFLSMILVAVTLLLA